MNSLDLLASRSRCHSDSTFQDIQNLPGKGGGNANTLIAVGRTFTSTPVADYPFLTSSSAFCMPSIPSKKCSCEPRDWNDSLLYSTASSASSKGKGETILSTATSVKPTLSQNHRSLSNYPGVSSPGPNGGDDNLDLNDIGFFNADIGDFSNIEVSSIHSDEEADEYLRRWLEEDRKLTSSISSTPITSIAVDAPSPWNYPDKDEKRGRKRKHEEEDDVKTQQDSLVNVAPPTPSSIISCGEMDSFVDLEAYATGSQAPTVKVDMNDYDMETEMELDSTLTSNSNQSSTGIDIDIDTLKHGVHLDFSVPVLQSKYNSHNSESELRFRLSLLDDLSRGFPEFDDRGVEKKDTSSFSPSSNSYHLKHSSSYQRNSNSTPPGFGVRVGNDVGHRRDSMDGVSFESVYSPLSPLSPSSVQSTAVHSPRLSEESLDLLGLFSEENSSMLMC